jgi:alpha-glucosidase
MKGIYSDQTNGYLNPEEPSIDDEVTIKLRIPKYLGKSIGSVMFTPEKNSKKYQHKPMQLSKETTYFYFFESTFKMPDKIVRYHFEIDLIEKDKKLFYDAMGLVENRAIHDFVFIADFKTPNWSHGSVYYQIFVDRFKNGDETNDPVSHEYHYDGQKVIKKDWNSLPHPKNGHREFYGGDLQGVLEKIDYLKELGVETIYLNPIFVSPSPHKYDTQDYEHVDPHFGVIEEDSEDLNEKYKVRTTSIKNLEKSDEILKILIQKAHEKNIKVILDGVFNHCGSFHKWIDEMDLYGEGSLHNEDSPYKSYFYWNSSQKGYEGWWGFHTLPKLNYGNISLWKYIADIGKKWVSEPFNADGWRLDVADELGKSFEMNTAFWRFFYKVVKKSNPESIIFAEIYKSPLAWLELKCWDSIMNYITCMDHVSYFLTGMEKHNEHHKPELLKNAEYFVNSVRWALSQLPMNSKFIALNQLSNHDHSRWMTRTTQKVGRLGPQTHEEASIGKDLDVFKIGLVTMFTLPGSPGLFYGDEIGMAGWTDPDNRRPYPWGKESEENKMLFNFTKELIKMYKEHPALRKGSFDFLDWNGGYVSYASWNESENIITVINREEKEIDIELPLWLLDKKEGEITLLFSTKDFNLGDNSYNDGKKSLKIPEKTALIFKIN